LEIEKETFASIKKSFSPNNEPSSVEVSSAFEFLKLLIHILPKHDDIQIAYEDLELRELLGKGFFFFFLLLCSLLLSFIESLCEQETLVKSEERFGRGLRWLLRLSTEAASGIRQT